MSLFKTIAFTLLTLTFSATAFAAPFTTVIKCVGSEYDIPSNYGPKSVPLFYDETDLAVTFKGQTQTGNFSVYVDKQTLSVFLTLEYKNAYTVQSQGTFNSQGFFETNMVSGTGPAMPQSAIAVSCEKK